MVISIGIGDAPVEHAMTSSYVADAGIPEHFKLIKHEVDLGFAFTYFKVQGRTLDYFILCLAKRSFPPHFTINSFAMLYSRVHTGKELFVLGLKDTSVQSTDHLRKLTHSPQIKLWENGYNADGIWDPEKVKMLAEKMASTQTRTRTNTFPNGTEANAAG